MSARSRRAIPTRRSHTKSRTGCYTCKQRHVKCDEGKPACENCVRRGMSCSFPQLEQLLVENAPTTEQCQQSSPGTLSNGVSQASNSPMSIPIRLTAPSTPPASTSCSPKQRFGMEDMSLLYHYTAHTSMTFTDLPELVKIYSEIAPEVAFSDPDLMSSLLAIAALHRAHVDPDPERREEYFIQATSHQHRSLGVLQDRVANLTRENCVGVFFSSSILSIYTLAAESWLWRSSPDAPSTACIDDVVRCLGLLRGVPSVLQHGNGAVFGWIMEGPLRPIGEGYLQKPKGRFTKDQKSHFTTLDRFLTEDEDAGEDERHVYLEALRVLCKYAELLLDRQVQQQIGVVGLTFTWPCIVSEQYLAYLEAHRRGALLLLAQYAVLFNRLRRFWWADAWGQTVLTLTVEFLPETWKCAILDFHESSNEESR